MLKEQICHVAVDTNIIINLVKLISPNYDPDRIISRLIKERTLNQTFKNTPRENLPPLLEDSLFSMKLNGKYHNIEVYSKLLDLIKKGNIKIYITESVKDELKSIDVLDFVDNFVTVLEPNEEEKEIFYKERDILINKFLLAGAFRKMVDKNGNVVINNDAKIMAEASLYGLNLLTGNTKHFIHYSISLKDYKITKLIYQVNKRNNVNDFKINKFNISKAIIPSHFLNIYRKVKNQSDNNEKSLLEERK